MKKFKVGPTKMTENGFEMMDAIIHTLDGPDKEYPIIFSYKLKTDQWFVALSNNHGFTPDSHSYVELLSNMEPKRYNFETKVEQDGYTGNCRGIISSMTHGNVLESLIGKKVKVTVEEILE